LQEKEKVHALSWPVNTGSVFQAKGNGVLFCSVLFFILGRQECYAARST